MFSRDDMSEITRLNSTCIKLSSITFSLTISAWVDRLLTTKTNTRQDITHEPMLLQDIIQSFAFIKRWKNRATIIFVKEMPGGKVLEKKFLKVPPIHTNLPLIGLPWSFKPKPNQSNQQSCQNFSLRWKSYLLPHVHPTCFGECWVNRSCNTQAFFSHRAVIWTSLLCFWRGR